LPIELLAGAASARLNEDASLLQYGAERGSVDSRERIARFLHAEDGRATDPARLFVTSGASQALDLFCTLYTRPGDLVITTEPTYHLALRLFADHGLEVRGLPSDERGPEIEALEATLEARGGRPKLLYLVSAFANPSGSTLAPERRERLLELAIERDFWLVSDEVYRLLAFDGQAPPTLARPDNHRAVSLNSFSKILAPGLRLGWVEAPEAVLRKMEDSGLLRSGGGLNPLVEALVGELLGDGRLSGHLHSLRQTYAERASALAEALRAHLPQARFEMPGGGYFIWARVPEHDSDGLLPVANRYGVNYQPGRRFSACGGLADHYRFSFAHYPPRHLGTAAERLAHAVQSQAGNESTVSQPFRE
jgi:2-aminoadipate transaminase